ncbi:AMP-binding protein [Streptomyces sp. NBC_00885]|uniref:AMP-binding protein n=1 Tax=Streptomyces sp. NBC_00885 TaxID=2975857 RepID=UPI003867277D
MWCQKRATRTAGRLRQRRRHLTRTPARHPTRSSRHARATSGPSRAGAFAAQVTPVAKALIIAGIEPGGRIAIMPRTRYEWAGPDFAVRAAGGRSVPNDAGPSPDRGEWIVRGSGTRHLIAESPERAEAVATGCTHAE